MMEINQMNNNQNNPQEVPQVKSVGTSFDETIALQKIKNLYAESIGFNSWPHFLNEYDPNERIYDLISVEYSNHQSAPLKARIAELEKQNSEFREALTNVMYPKLSKSTDEAQEQWYDILIAAEQALNPKDK